MIFIVITMLLPLIGLLLPQQWSKKIICAALLGLAMQFRFSASLHQGQTPFDINLFDTFTWGIHGWDVSATFGLALSIPLLTTNRKSDWVAIFGVVCMLYGSSLPSWIVGFGLCLIALGEKPWVLFPSTIAVVGSYMYPEPQPLQQLAMICLMFGSVVWPFLHKPKTEIGRALVPAFALLSLTPIICTKWAIGMAIGGPLLGILALLGIAAHGLRIIFGSHELEEDIYMFWMHLGFFGLCSLQPIGWDGAAVLLVTLPLLYLGTKNGSILCRFSFFGLPPFPNVICLVMILLGMWSSVWSARLYWVIVVGLIWGGILARYKKTTTNGQITEKRLIATTGLLLFSLYPSIIFHSIQTVTPTFLANYWAVFQQLFAGEFPTWI